MGLWEASSLKMSGAEYEVQEALLGLRRLIQTGGIRPTTRVILEGAIQVLENELESTSERCRPDLSPRPYQVRSAAPK